MIMRWRGWLVVAALLACVAGPARAAVDEADLLPVDEAFVLTATPDPAGIRVHWAVAEGYYLYRHRTAVRAGDGFAPSGELRLPAGKRHTDEFFGEVETYRGTLAAILPGNAATPGARVELSVKYQGCADVGVCYPPQTRSLAVVMPGGAAAPADSGFAALGRRLGLGGTAATPAPAAGKADALPLPPAQAFGFEAIAGDGNTLLLRFTPAPGYYLYRDQTRLAVSQAGAAGAPAILGLGPPRWPPGRAHRDAYFGDTTVYFNQIDVPVPVLRGATKAAALDLVATFQGCQTDGICYPPMTRRVRVALPAGALSPATAVRGNVNSGALPGAAPGAASPAGAPIPAMPAARDSAGTAAVATGPAPAAPDTGADTRGAAQATPAAVADDSRIARALAGPNRAWTLLGFFGAGLLLAFTPCVLPMIPILSGLIAGQGTRIGTRRALVLSLVYVLANALVFTAAGVVAGLVGANLQVAFQTPWVIVAFALLFMVLALSSFGLYSMQLPAVLRARLGSISDRQRGGSLFGVAAMGALSALIVGPCVAPPLAAAVLYIGQARDPVLGGVALFLLAMGMGLPLLAFGAAAGRGMPTSGPWMTAAQRVFGFVFLGLAIWMLSRILPPAITLGLYGALALAAAAWAWSSTGASSTGRQRAMAHFAGLLLAVIGAAQLLGALGGGRDPLQPLAGVFARGAPQASLVFRTVKSAADVDREVAAAAAAGRPVLFDFYADWCVACKEMEKYTFTDPAVQSALEGFVLLKADVTANDAVDQALMRRHGIIGPPATLYFVDRRERRDLRLFGFERAGPFVERTRRAMAGLARSDANAAQAGAVDP